MGDLDPTSYYKGEDGGLDAADIAGIVIGITLGIPMVMAIGWGFIICYRRKIAPKRSGQPKPESNKEVAQRIQADFAIDPELIKENDDEEQKEAIEMEPITHITVATSPTFTSVNTLPIITTTTTTTSTITKTVTPDSSPESTSMDDRSDRV